MEDADATVENLSRAGMNHGIEMSSPALDKRFDETSAKFLQTVFVARYQVLLGNAGLPSSAWRSGTTREAELRGQTLPSRAW